MQAKDWIGMRLHGRAFTDLSEAAGTLWLDQAARDWYHSPEYSGVKTIRQEASTGALTIVEGLE